MEGHFVYSFGYGDFAVVFVVLSGIILFMGIKTVPQGFEYTIERWGRYIKTLSPGLAFIIPFVDRVGRRINMMEQVLDISRQECITKDNAMVSVDGVVFFQILDSPKAAYEVNNLEMAIQNLGLTNIRNVMGSMDLDELLSQRDKINASLLNVIDSATDPWGVKVTRVEIKDITPPRDLVESMARQMKSEREKRAEILEAEGRKQSEILEAEGRRAAAFLDAEARERSAEAEAKATQMVSQAIEAGNTNAVSYFLGLKYIEALQQIGAADNQKIVFMPLEASGIIGALGGIGELVKETVVKKK